MAYVQTRKPGETRGRKMKTVPPSGEQHTLDAEIPEDPEGEAMELQHAVSEAGMLGQDGIPSVSHIHAAMVDPSIPVDPPIPVDPSVPGDPPIPVDPSVPVDPLIPVDPPPDAPAHPSLRWEKPHHIIVMQRGYAFTWDKIPRARLQGLTRMACELPDGTLLHLYDLDQRNLDQALYRALYTRKNIPLWIIIMGGIVLFIFMLIGGVMAYSAITGGGEKGSSGIIPMKSDLGGSPSVAPVAPPATPTPTTSTGYVPLVHPPIESTTPPVDTTKSDLGSSTTSPLVHAPSSGGGIIEAHDYVDECGVCPSVDPIPRERSDDDIAYISLLEGEKEEQKKRAEVCESDYTTLMKEVDGDRNKYECWLGARISERCSDIRNKNMCEKLYYNYRTGSNQ